MEGFGWSQIMIGNQISETEWTEAYIKYVSWCPFLNEITKTIIMMQPIHQENVSLRLAFFKFVNITTFASCEFYSPKQ